MMEELKPMRIKIKEKDKINGFSILLTSGSIVCLPNNEYIVPKHILNELEKKHVNFKIIKYEDL